MEKIFSRVDSPVMPVMMLVCPSPWTLVDSPPEEENDSTRPVAVPARNVSEAVGTKTEIAFCVA
jgi:hypothetical protein